MIYLFIFISCYNIVSNDERNENNINNTCWDRKFIQIEASIGAYCLLDNCGKFSCYWRDGVDMGDVGLITGGTYKYFSIIQKIETEYLPYPVSGCAIDLNGIAHCWKSGGYNDFYKFNENEIDFLSLTYNGYCGIYNYGTPECYPDVFLSDKILDYKFRYLSISQSFITGMTYDNESILFNMNNELFLIENQNTVTSTIFDACSSNNDYTGCWNLYEAPTMENANFIDFDHIGSNICGSYSPCILQYDGSVWCWESSLRLDFDEPLVSLSCGTADPYKGGNLLCGLTAAGEGRCWTEERGYWEILP